MYAYTAAQIRAAEKPLLDAQDSTDQLMQAAAHAVFEAAETMLAWPTSGAPNPECNRTLLLVGPGGNGGDALYAGAELALHGYPVDAWLITGTAHEPALTAFKNAGGTLTDDPLSDSTTLYRLTIDGMFGIGGRGGLSLEVGNLLEVLEVYTDILAVDVPSGVDADSGEVSDIYVTADVTVTFGGWRLAHGLAPECGEQLLADVGIPGRTISDELQAQNNRGELTQIHRATHAEHQWPASLTRLEAARISGSAPGPYDNKYTGGVVGICAGSGKYPGAAILSTAGAVKATPGMVRYAGPQALEVVRAHPEVVATDSIAEAGRVQVWVYGPGAGTDDPSDLRELLNTDTDLIIDADGLTLFAENEVLRQLVVKRNAVTVLTPHDGEFARLREAMGLEESNRLAETKELAATLGCAMVRKGRATIIVSQPSEAVEVVDTGNSWAATPGSGDVLAGLMGARLARDVAKSSPGASYGLADSVQVHAQAAQLAARTEYGEESTSASAIAEQIPAATAKLVQPFRRF
ncbi:bifunctional ADP-dependent NAD(P)H-hydrate dehydratase/NAD(P)H-hydrate epimerase [Corynebacterium lubricantis]|uniref:bifunctional ADP-dependent NAD(P)H-hydrate dehydratase/NAD(P)H-hydrate epimerase n=1 Tax=Corynebacterium lubricantis TaxID=541095 RepID=UPI00037A38B9|nr:bifunctional ADP-dependent NAD(P)H-hydrate dehydratase/NAD(P)H-hydrate epimerase [Corynebacterium lubricantis]